MRFAPIAASILTLGLAAATAASAQTTSGMMNGSAPVGMQKARCNPSDPAVMVNMKNKSYMPYAQAVSMMKQGKTASTSPQTGTSEMKSVCTSTAKSMGFKMSSAGSGQMNKM